MRRGLTTARLLVISFAIAIAAGTFLLLLPVAMQNSAGALAPVDALFTATSAVCVTGLSVRDTGTEFSFFGQAIILMLVQLGGLGILTLSNAIFFARSHRFGLQERAIITETVGIHRSLSPSSLLWRVFIFTFACEFVGAIILTLRFSVYHPFPTAVWMGVFHAVSAFCNAGFGLLTDSLMQYHSDLVVNVTIMALIVLGGIGFFVAADCASSLRGFRSQVKRRLSFHSRVVLRTTGILIVLGWVLFTILEIRSPSTSASGTLLLETLFLSVTARTAGFNTVDIAGLSNAGLLILMLLMVIGGSPGSTAGGIKTTTAATLYALVRSRAANRPKVELLDRSIPHDIQAKAFASTAAYLAFALLAVLMLELSASGGETRETSAAEFLPRVFEVVSALATVGLSTGITADLNPWGKLIITMCMFSGRLGTLIVASSLVGAKRRLDYTYPEERMMVG